MTDLFFRVLTSTLSWKHSGFWWAWALSAQSRTHPCLCDMNLLGPPLLSSGEAPEQMPHCIWKVPFSGAGDRYGDAWGVF